VRSQDPPRADALNHTPIRYVNNVLSELMDGKPPELDLPSSQSYLPVS
jgi:hypothetical protein